MKKQIKHAMALFSAVAALGISAPSYAVECGELGGPTIVRYSEYRIVYNVEGPINGDTLSIYGQGRSNPNGGVDFTFHASVYDPNTGANKWYNPYRVQIVPEQDIAAVTCGIFEQAKGDYPNL